MQNNEIYLTRFRSQHDNAPKENTNTTLTDYSHRINRETTSITREVNWYRENLRGNEQARKKLNRILEKLDLQKDDNTTIQA